MKKKLVTLLFSLGIILFLNQATFDQNYSANLAYYAVDALNGGDAAQAFGQAAGAAAGGYAGAWAGGKIGATIGTAAGPVGTVVGGIIGAGVGAL